MKRALRYLRALVWTLDVPSAKHPRLRRAAEQIGSPIAVLCGLTWATFIAGYLAAQDHVRDPFAEWLYTLGMLLVISTFMQVLHHAFGTKSLHDALAFGAQAAIGIAVTLAVTDIGAYLNGVEFVRNSQYGKASAEFIACMDEEDKKFSSNQEAVERAGLELARCQSNRQSDRVNVTAAFMEGRLTKEMVDDLEKISAGGCKIITEHMEMLIKKGKEMETSKCPPMPVPPSMR
ncbi:MAG: hypothetical protein ABL908_06590 [Hyphomicrobium sp.]